MAGAAAGAIYLAAGQATAEQVIADDLVVTGNVCLGQDCSGGQSYLGAVAVLRDEDPGIFFDDTSVSIYADRDWRLQIGEPGQFGEERFAVIDETSGTMPLVIEGRTPGNTLRLERHGRVGIGTAMPETPVHLVAQNIAVMRLQYTGANNGTWDIVSDRYGFAIKNPLASSYPLNITPDAENELLWLAGERMGIGTDLPETALHIVRGNGEAALLIEETSAGTLGQMVLRNNGITYFTLEDTSIPAGDYSGRAWNFQNQGGTFRVTTAPGGAGDIEMRMTPQGDMYIKGELFTGTGGASTACDNGCDRVFDADYPLPGIAEHAAEMREKGHLPAVGPTGERGPFNLTKMTGGMLNELEKAHLYIAELHGTVAQQTDEIARLKTELSRLDALEAKIEALTERR